MDERGGGIRACEAAVVPADDVLVAECRVLGVDDARAAGHAIWGAIGGVRVRRRKREV